MYVWYRHFCYKQVSSHFVGHGLRMVYNVVLMQSYHVLVNLFTYVLCLLANCGSFYI